MTHTELVAGNLGLAPKWIRLATNRTNLGFFKISFNTFWLRKPKWTETDLKEFKISPIRANLKHFDAKPKSIFLIQNENYLETLNIIFINLLPNFTSIYVLSFLVPILTQPICNVIYHFFFRSRAISFAAFWFFLSLAGQERLHQEASVQGKRRMREILPKCCSTKKAHKDS